MFACIGILLRISGFMIIILYLFISCLLLIFYSTCFLLLSDHTMSLPYLSIHMCLSILAIWLSHHHSPGSSDFSGSSCPGLGAWSMWILLVADQSGAAVTWISSRPSRAHPSRPSCSALKFSCYDSEPSICTIYTCTSPCILAFAPYW